MCDIGAFRKNYFVVFYAALSFAFKLRELRQNKNHSINNILTLSESCFMKVGSLITFINA